MNNKDSMEVDANKLAFVVVFLSIIVIVLYSIAPVI